MVIDMIFLTYIVSFLTAFSKVFENIDNYQQVFITDYLLLIVIDYLRIFKCLSYCRSIIFISTWLCNLVRIHGM